MMKKASLVIAMLLVMGSSGFAVAFEKIRLQAVNGGVEMGAIGRAIKGDQGGVEFFGVDVRANLPEGTVLTVIVGDGTQEFTAGSITMSLGAGSLRVCNGFLCKNVLQPPPNGVFPIQNIQTVRVVDVDEDILTGEF